MYNADYLTQEKFYKVLDSSKGSFALLNDLESLDFIDLYLDGKIVKKTLRDSDNLINVYFNVGENKPIAFSRLWPCGYNFFCRKVGVQDVRRTGETLLDDRQRCRTEKDYWSFTDAAS